MAEKEAMLALDHPFILKLHATMKDYQCLYFLLEYCPGGELQLLLDQEKALPEACVQFYAAQITAALDHIHQQQIVHRDLKLSNILLDQLGYVKLIDFGLCKKLGSNEARSYTCCGTPEYLPPEMLTREGHAAPADWWALGVIMYELLTG